MFTYLASIIVLALFWILLEKVNQSGDVSYIGPGDKKIFWVKMYINCIFIKRCTCADIHLLVRSLFPRTRGSRDRSISPINISMQVYIADIHVYYTPIDLHVYYTLC